MSMTPLQSVPAHVRTIIYWVGYVVGALSQGITLIWGVAAASSPNVSMPFWLIIASAGLAFLQTQLNLLAGSNVSSDNTIEISAPEDIDIVTVETGQSLDEYPEGH